MSSNITGQPGASSVVDMLGYVHGYAILVIIIVGAMGNTLTLVVFFRANRGSDPTVQYFTCITIADTAVLIFLAVPDWPRYGMPYVIGNVSFNLYGTSNITCKLFQFCFFTSATFSSLCLVSFTMERAIFVWFPFKRALLSSRNRKYIIAAIFIVSIVSNTHVAVFFENHSGAAGSDFLYCYYKDVTVDFITDSLRYVIIPCLLILIFNLIIIFGLLKSQKKNKAVSAVQRDDKSGSVLVNLFLVSLFYIVFNIPRTVIWTYYEVLEDRHSNVDPLYMEMLYLVANISELFWLMNYCTNFVIYGVSLPFYREEVSRMCLCPSNS